MKKFKKFVLVVILILLIKNNSNGQNIELIKTTHLKHYPSASTIEFYKDHLYVIGDDANQLLILDKEHKIVDSILLFKGQANRVSKDDKADIESSTLVFRNNHYYILALSSFSTPKRNKALIIDTDRKSVHKKSISKSSYNIVGIKELNIEATAYINNQIILANRANNSSKINHLIVTNINKRGKIKNKTSIPLPISDKGVIVGISGFVYIKSNDMLLFTASTENTSNATLDGTIGNSYIGMIKNISARLIDKKLVVDHLLNLSETIGNQPQKIEGIAIESEINRDLIIHLAADNDNGESTLFKIILKNYL